MAGLLVCAFAVAARGLRDGRTSRLVMAGVLVGLAFEVKLFEALLAGLPLALMWWLGASGSRWERARALVLAAGACVVVALAWLVALTVLVPAPQRPWAFGSSNGSAWNAVFGYNGWNRLAGHMTGNHTVAGAQRIPAPAGPLRLLSSQVHLGQRVGVELVLAWVAVAATFALRAWRRLDRAGRAGLLGLVAWLALGTVFFSIQNELRSRYLEGFDPAIAACLGLGAILTWDALGPRLRAHAAVRAGAVALVVAALAQPVAVTAAAISSHVQDSGTPGSMPQAQLAAISRYALAHQRGARYEAAFANVSAAGSLITRDGRPILMLLSQSHPLVSVPRLAALVRAGRVRTAVLGTSRSAAARWIRAHGTDVSRALGARPGSVIGL
jgi:4-amino-4-deoxy-L-arabinose transferase-like glycosyltransferase